MSNPSPLRSCPSGKPNKKRRGTEVPRRFVDRFIQSKTPWTCPRRRRCSHPYRDTRLAAAAVAAAHAAAVFLARVQVMRIVSPVAIQPTQWRQYSRAKRACQDKVAPGGYFTARTGKFPSRKHLCALKVTPAAVADCSRWPSGAIARFGSQASLPVQFRKLADSRATA